MYTSRRANYSYVLIEISHISPSILVHIKVFLRTKVTTKNILSNKLFARLYTLYMIALKMWSNIVKVIIIETHNTIIK
uniref:Uncharacterized protein n=1 Tax=Parietochloris pseudoalveolaris TaxID=3102 RepID=A0A097KLP7_9CHLO|nr:hypothetical protein [Parietochloris pseudoalveolaris]AIT94111.1 hypothetical protein [Parietochloris pseudoalveolaris]